LALLAKKSEKVAFRMQPVFRVFMVFMFFSEHLSLPKTAFYGLVATSYFQRNFQSIKAASRAVLLVFLGWLFSA
jgi:hypothetical protein